MRRLRALLAFIVVATAALAGFGSRPAAAIPTDPTDNPCMSGGSFSLSVSRGSVVWGQSVALRWSASMPAGCPITGSVRFVADGTGLTYSEPAAASQTLTPPASGSYHLVVLSNAYRYDVASAHVGVTFPAVAGHPWARLTPLHADQAATFNQLVRLPNARVYIQGDVDLDLSGLADVPVAPGVSIIGERNASHPHGPRLFTTTSPRHLLLVGNDGDQSTADNVRITGLRLDGQASSDPCDDAGLPNDSDAIFVYASRGVEIDHDELYRWRGSAINVQDNDDVPADQLPAGQQHDRVNRDSLRFGVWVYQNYIHDNQHPTVCSSWNPLASNGHGAGYGVNASHGGFPYIEGNVFSDNRHSIAGHGSNGDGYIVIGNIFGNPGIDDVKIITNYNHQIDMHGLETCGGGEHFNCGQAGLYMEVEHNIVIGVTAAAIQLRGTPTSYNPDTNTGGMYVHDNAFAACRNCALTQTTTGLVTGDGNTFDQANVLNQLFTSSSLPGPACDFDGDGQGDQFRTTAGDFWYHSSELGRWVFMSTLSAAGAVSLGDRNGDGLCDVSDTLGVRYTSPPPFPAVSLPATVPPLTGLTEAAAADAVPAAGLVVDTVAHVASLSPAGTVIAQSRAAGTTPQAGSLVALTVSTGGVALPNVVGWSEAVARGALTTAGLPVGSVSYSMNPATAGTVYAQSPASTGSTIVTPGTAVSLNISLGQRTVPNILSFDASSANAAITGAGLVRGRVSTVNNCVDAGTVQVQNPSAGTHVLPGAEVNYTLSTCVSTGGPGGGGRPPIQPK